MIPGGRKLGVLVAMTIVILMVSGLVGTNAQAFATGSGKPITGIENPVTIARAQGGDTDVTRTWVAPYNGYFHQWLVNSGLRGIEAYTYDITSKPTVVCSSILIKFSDAGAYPTGTVQCGYFEVQKDHVYKWAFSPTGRAGTSADYYWSLEPKSTPPVAAFTYSFSGSALTVDASSSYDPDGAIVQYLWEWGDGLIGFGVQASHQYAMYGGHKVTLTVTDNDGLKSKLSKSTPPPFPFDLYGFVTDSNGIPVDGCAVEVTDVWTGASLTAVTGPISGYEGAYMIDLCTIPGGWKLGDTFEIQAVMGSTSGSSQVVVNSLAPPFVEVDLTLTEGVPTADAGPDQYLYGQVSVQLDGSSSSSDVGIAEYVWTWTAGNGVKRSTTGVMPSFPTEWFFAYGNYTLTLTVIDNAGKRATDTLWISFGFRIYDDTPMGVEGIATPSTGWFKLRIENHGMTSFDWTVMDCGLTLSDPATIVFSGTVTFSSADQVLVTDGCWMLGGHYYQSEYVPNGPSGSYMDIYSYFVPSS